MKRREIYWASRTSASSGGGIYKAEMDGSSPTLVLGIGYVEGISIDYEQSRIYWAASYTSSTIESSDLDGNGRQTFITTSPDIYKLRIFGSEIYWLQSGIGIRSASKFDGSNERTIASGSINTAFLTVLSSDVQPSTRVNNCAGDPCSHICVLTATNYRCLCPEGLQLNKTDGKTCCK